MAKISELPDAAPLTGDELIPVVQNGITRKINAAGVPVYPATPEITAAFWQHAGFHPAPISESVRGFRASGGTLSSSAVGLLRYARTAYPVRAPQPYHGVRGGGH
jgi:hypothetical protein